MTIFSTSIASPNSPTNPPLPHRSTPPEALSRPHSIHQPVTRFATFICRSPTVPDVWGTLAPGPESASSWIFSDDLDISMESGGNEGDRGKGKDKGTSRQSTPSTHSSQGDMADNEGEGSSSQVGEHAELPPPPKKKRTRTLTTPHQAAVLHALLTQSRFPTTAMREEVGRAIGLSARKVQIWFQNQRQKARRPKGQNVPPLTRPPQYGPFPSIPSGSTIGEHAPPAGPSGEGGWERHGGGELQGRHGAPHSAPSTAGPDAFGFRDTMDSERSSRAQSFLPQLSGPGIPGSPPSASRSPRPIRSAPYARHHPPLVAGSSAFRPEGLPMHRPGHSFPAPYPLPGTRPYTADDSPRSLRTLARPGSPPVRHPVDFDVRLPPLRLPRGVPRTPSSRDVDADAAAESPLSGQFSAMREPAPAPALPPIAGPSATRPHTADSPFAFAPAARIPPPFTLQPRPQWDDASFSPFSRPRSQPRSPTSPFPPMPYEPLIVPPPPPHRPRGPSLPPPPSYAVPPHERAPDDRPSPVPRLRRDDDSDDEASHDPGVAR